MKKLFIPYELALLAQEKGFDKYFKLGNITSLYDKKGNFIPYTNYGVMYSGLSDGYISAPLYQQLIDWFREEHKIEIYCLKQIEENEYGGIVGWSGIEEYSTKSCDADYYKALNKTFEEAFKLIQ